MNAPATIAQLAKPTDQVLPIGSIVPSPSKVQELRRSRFDQAALQGLADNIKQVGLLQPIVVRPLAAAGKYELVAGERRWIAAKKAGLTEIRASVCALTPDQAVEVQLVENLQREELHEMEEAEGYHELMQLKKLKAEDVAAMVGVSRSQIYARTKLLALCPEARKAFYAGELDASRALLIARIGHHDTQRQAMKEILKNDGYDEPMSFREAHHHILQRYMLKLSAAPFDIKDAALLPKAGACGPCPKRTGNQADMFSDVKSADVCTDPKCFDDKRQAHFAGARMKHEAAGRKVIYGADAKKLLPHWEHNDNGYIKGDYIRMDGSDYFAGRYQKVAAVLGKDYVPTLIQHPASGAFIEVAPKSTVSAKASAMSRTRQKPRATSSGSSKPSPAAQKAEQEKKIERAIIGGILKALHAKITTLGKEDLVELVISPFTWDGATDELCAILGWSKNQGGKAIENKARALKPEQILKVGFLLCLAYRENADYDDAPMMAAAKRYKIDPKAIEKEVRARLTPAPKPSAVDKVKAEIQKREVKAKAKAKKKGGKK